MSKTWLKNFEKILESKFEAFLRSNPYQESLINQQTQNDIFTDLSRQRQHIQEEAKSLREEIINLAKDVQDWKIRSEKARKAGSKSLASQAEAHLNHLMDQGRDLWYKLELLGGRFEENQIQLSELSQNLKPDGYCLEKDWEKFDANLELEKLRRKKSN